MKVLVTGAQGFIGRNLMVHLRERAGIEVQTFVKGESWKALGEKAAQADFIFHLAGINRPQTEAEFAQGNTDLTQALCDALRASGRAVPVIYTSSIQAQRDNAYGSSKRGAEDALRAFSAASGAPVYIYRLPNVFGKWCRPNYNSAVATFCHNIAQGLPVQINDPAAQIELVYIDDVIAAFLDVMQQTPVPAEYQEVQPVYRISVGALAQQLQIFKDSRTNLVTEAVGGGLTRALYSTFITYFTPEQFSYPLVKHEDPRGVFVEMLKTHDAGQFSFFTAHPGITRGGHYHHTKTEKFLVIKGEARFGFRHIDSGATHQHCTSAKSPEVVETIPGWSHDITNIGDEEMIVMLWANEIFDRQHPDTITYKV
ncbi:NAD-dependent epimerase/dehydratase family protein [Janthinobacterium sp. GW460P]|uniref:UDP-2-acetamido-2,6-beta-L-arabino-hexul-4-ose reductase n=1 Tax=unclassified Janthinobacterium TaxID=2610881 RepID=UPI000A320500|nr:MULTISPECIES: NAD-dependent epimerase/dehydratase family protein [unclassified Janthinobacterium]MCC7701837.1 NAD-dependent epimerase/dehydratase family protein [Janthinobacterium sp. GW460P]MCC7707345.1 NAD-dependent epimerase/dehydratase family protein [Janthinobacterium sp. GW460W]PHV38919.1 capsular biosynthesis protein [Janthinobacterium sp. BJB304]